MATIAMVSIYCEDCGHREIAEMPIEEVDQWFAPCHPAENQHGRTIHATREETA